MINTFNEVTGGRTREQMVRSPVEQDTTFIFASYAESDEQLQHTVFLVESIREFAGIHARAPVRVYLPETYEPSEATLIDRLHGLEVSVHTVGVPEESRWLYYSGKVYAAAVAEQQAVGMTSVLVWMDEDTVVLQPPDELSLAGEKVLAFRPVMHNRSGSELAKPPDTFWKRVYELVDIDTEQLFPMMTIADKVTIRPYFNAGLLAVRPEVGMLRRWPVAFERLYEDETICELCRGEEKWRIFLHQAALVGAVLNLVDQSQLVELDNRYNYPLFFEEHWQSADRFDDISDVVTLRYDTYFRDPAPRWAQMLTGRTEVIDWLTARFGEC